MIHGATMSMKAVCLCPTHKSSTGTSAAVSSSAAPPSRHQEREKQCYLLLHAPTNVWEKYETCARWLKDGPVVSHKYHFEAGKALGSRKR